MQAEAVACAKKVMQQEIEGLTALIDSIGGEFEEALFAIEDCKGKVVISGMGKSGYVGKKISATLSSTGTTSIFLHPAEASHGDLGMITQRDIAILLSNSGETQELNAIISYCKFIGIKIIGITRNSNSTLYEVSDIKILIPSVAEANAIGAPTTSAIMMMSWGDALAVTLFERKGFSKEDYKLLHPGGSIGSKLLKIKDIMHQNKEIPTVYSTSSFHDTIIEMTSKRLGCVAVINALGALIGIITDGDLRRHIEEDLSKKTAKDLMTINPLSINCNMIAAEAFQLMHRKSITQLCIVDNDLKLTGIVHIHDLIKAGFDAVL